MAVRTYSLRAEGNLELSKNFKVKEFACKDKSDKIMVCRELVLMLQAIRDFYGREVVINSGYRTESYNKSIKGATGSLHLKGRAADFVVKGVEAKQVRADIEAGRIKGVDPSKIGLGYYLDFTHIDTRGFRSRF